VAGSCEYGYEPTDSGTMKLVKSVMDYTVLIKGKLSLCLSTTPLKRIEDAEAQLHAFVKTTLHGSD
jgi:hypothetical protein